MTEAVERWLHLSKFARSICLGDLGLDASTMAISCCVESSVIFLPRAGTDFAARDNEDSLVSISLHGMVSYVQQECRWFQR